MLLDVCASHHLFKLSNERLVKLIMKTVNINKSIRTEAQITSARRPNIGDIRAVDMIQPTDM